MAKETWMKLKVDMDCDRCYTKVKRILCQIPQIRDQSYLEKDSVAIRVVCCSPCKIADKIRAKGGKSIKSIEMINPIIGPPWLVGPLNSPKTLDPKNPTVGKTIEGPPVVKQKQAEAPTAGQPANPTKKPEAPSAMMAPMVSPPVVGYGYPANGGSGYGYGVPPPPPQAGGYGYGYGYGYGVPPPPPPAYYHKPSYDGDYFSDENASGCVVM